MVDVPTSQAMPKTAIKSPRALSLGGSGRKISLQCRRPRFDPWIGKIPGWKKWQPIPLFLPEEFHGQRSLVGYSSWGPKELDMTE